MTNKCPWCDSNKVDAEFVDVGVGAVQATPWCCYDCGASQIDWRHYAGLNGDDYYKGHIYDPPPDAEEQKRGWMRGNNEKATATTTDTDNPAGTSGMGATSPEAN